MNFNLWHQQDIRDYIFRLTDEEKLKIGTLPKEYTIIKHLPPIQNQGDESNCVGIVLATVKYYQEMNDDKQVIEFEPDFVYDLRPKFNDSIKGMDFNDALKILKKEGCLPTKYYKKFCTQRDKIQNTSYLWRGDSKRAKKEQNLLNVYRELAQQYVISSYAKIQTLEYLKYAIYSYGIVIVGLPVYNKETNFWIQRKSDKLLGGHAVCFVGYNDQEQVFVLRNSWGEDYGIKGYSCFPYKDFGVHMAMYVCLDEDTDLNVVNKILEVEEATTKRRLSTTAKNIEKDEDDEIDIKEIVKQMKNNKLKKQNV